MTQALKLVHNAIMGNILIVLMSRANHVRLAAQLATVQLDAAAAPLITICIKTPVFTKEAALIIHFMLFQTLIVVPVMQIYAFPDLVPLKLSVQLRVSIKQSAVMLQLVSAIVRIPAAIPFAISMSMEQQISAN